MSSLLDRKDRKQLWEWIGKPSRFDLLFKASRDGCAESAFHTLCDNKGPTVTVLHNTEGSVFGGYTSQSWNGSDSYVSDSNAFLFRLKSKGHTKRSKFPVTNSSKKRQHAIYCGSSNGPIFGGGHDLHTFTGTVQKSNGYFDLNGSCNYGHSYDMSGEDANTFNDGHLKVKDIEVYTVKDRKDRKQLWEWIGKPSRFDLLFKASRDGCAESAFHTLCDNKGPTVTVLHNTEGSVFGGYTSQSWNGSDSYVSDSNAFLFRLKSKGHTKRSKFPVTNSSKKRQHAIYCGSSNGPIFGGGHDLHTFTGTVQKSNGYFDLNGSCNYGHSYDMSGEDANTFNDGHLKVKDIEVYTVKDGEDVGGLLETPWRAEPDWSNEALQMLKTTIRGYKPPKELENTEVNILLLGQVAAGKSSLINTIQSVFRGEVSARARSGTAENSLTIKFRRYRLKDNENSCHLNFRLCDTRGLEPGAGLQSLDIGYLLDGHIPEHYQFNPLTAISPTSFGFIKSPNVKDKVHAVILVIDASTFDVMPEGIIDKIKYIQTVFNARDLPQVIFMTKIDKLCPDVSNDLTNVFRSETTFEVLSKISDCFGLPRGHIFPVKNYENETELDGNINILVLKALKQLLNFTDEYIEDQYGDLLCGSDSVQVKD